METKNWFQTWFNSKYYHVLYKNRDENEAQDFINSVFGKFEIPTNSRILDLACGKGRHAAYMTQNGMDVTGLDLSLNSIETAIHNYKLPNLEFAVHDMRNPSRINYYDYVFNFFTSIGYFENLKENEKVFQAISLSLKKHGYLMMDFFNAEKVIANLVEREEKVVDEIAFYIRRNYENGIITKHIQFEAEHKIYNFKEQVQALMPEEFEQMAEKAGLEIKEKFGSYKLENFDNKNSDRFILWAQKK
ncbi:MAG: class I SAM-dependent methyltransferase [Bacteroidetes bacterium]|nr:class I SAM-dependent methyltransferase [Bacteroidota bacterium]